MYDNEKESIEQEIMIIENSLNKIKLMLLEMNSPEDNSDGDEDDDGDDDD